jgi:hypothetical protein
MEWAVLPAGLCIGGGRGSCQCEEGLQVSCVDEDFENCLTCIWDMHHTAQQQQPEQKMLIWFGPRGRR